MKLSLLFILPAVATSLLAPLYPFQLFFPAFALVAIKQPHLKALWFCALSGLFLDFLCSSSPMGFHAVIFVITMLILFPYRRFFFEEKCLPFLFYATLFSSLNSLLIAIAYCIMNHRLYFSFQFVITDLIFLPLCDAACGYLVFVMPKLIIRFFKRALLQWRWRSS